MGVTHPYLECVYVARLLRLTTFSSQLTHLQIALLGSAPGLSDIAVLAVFFFVVLAILGVDYLGAGFGFRCLTPEDLSGSW